MKDLNKLQKWAKVVFVITVFFFLGYTLYWIVFMLSIANYSSANVIGSDYVVMSIYLTCFDIVGFFAAALLRSIWTEETPFLMKNVRWLKLLALALLLSEPICKLSLWCQRHFTGHQFFNTELGMIFYPMAIIAYILALVFQYGVVLQTQADETL